MNYSYEDLIMTKQDLEQTRIQLEIAHKHIKELEEKIKILSK